MIYELLALPGGGKTTWCENAKNKAAREGISVGCVSAGSLIMKVVGQLFFLLSLALYWRFFIGCIRRIDTFPKLLFLFKITLLVNYHLFIYLCAFFLSIFRDSVLVDEGIIYGHLKFKTYFPLFYDDSLANLYLDSCYKMKVNLLILEVPITSAISQFEKRESCVGPRKKRKTENWGLKVKGFDEMYSVWAYLVSEIDRLEASFASHRLTLGFEEEFGLVFGTK